MSGCNPGDAPTWTPGEIGVLRQVMRQREWRKNALRRLPGRTLSAIRAQMRKLRRANGGARPAVAVPVVDTELVRQKRWNGATLVEIGVLYGRGEAWASKVCRDLGAVMSPENRARLSAINGASAGHATAKARAIAEADKPRRPCLCCGRSIVKTGPGQRLCGSCRVQAQEVSPYAI